MKQPLQNPPVERLYMRLVVSHDGLPDATGGDGKRGGGRKSARPASGGDYFIGLTTFHIRAPRAGR